MSEIIIATIAAVSAAVAILLLFWAAATLSRAKELLSRSSAKLASAEAAARNES